MLWILKHTIVIKILNFWEPKIFEKFSAYAKREILVSQKNFPKIGPKYIQKTQNLILILNHKRLVDALPV